MAKDVADLKKLVQFAREHGLKRLVHNGIEFEFNEPTATISPPQQGTSLASLSEEEKPPSEDEMLFYSTEYYEQLRAERKQSGAQ